MKYFLSFFTFLLVATGFSQSADLNAYEFVIVPLKFEFQKNENQYRINTLTKFLLENEGFKVFFEGQQPVEIANAPCQALKAELIDESGVFTTRVKLALNDCYGNPVFITAEGSSKIKEYEPSYHQAIKNAFEDIKSQQYTYDPSAKKTSAKTVVAATPVVEQSPVSKPVMTDPVTEKIDENNQENKTLQVLYAQPVTNGFQLVDTTPAIRFRIRKTGKADTFSIIGKDGVLYRNKEGNWVAEYYENETLITEVYRVKF